MPPTIPVLASTVARLVLLLAHVPAGAELKVVNEPMQTVRVPVIDEGNALTVIGLIAVQPAGNVYIIVSKPGATPVTVTIPLPDPTVANAVLLLLHVPPIVASPRMIVEVTHTWFGPVIATGV